jgi:hypothetical protein
VQPCLDESEDRRQSGLDLRVRSEGVAEAGEQREAPPAHLQLGAGQVRLPRQADRLRRHLVQLTSQVAQLG